jgi:hypothetical protein
MPDGGLRSSTNNPMLSAGGESPEVPSLADAWARRVHEGRVEDGERGGRERRQFPRGRFFPAPLFASSMEEGMAKLFAIVAVSLALASCSAARAVPGAPPPLHPIVDNDHECAQGRERGSASYNWCRWLRGS